MKFSITLIDYGKLDAKKKYAFELARAGKIRDAVTIAFALSRQFQGQHASLSIRLRTRSREKEVGDVYCGRPLGDEAAYLLKCEERLRAIAQAAEKAKRISAFQDRYLKGIDHEEWKRRWPILSEPAVSSAIHSEDYELAAQLIAQAGLTPNEPHSPEAASV